MFQGHVTPLPLAWVAAIHTACLLALIAILAGRRPASAGWRIIGPGGTHWFCFIGSWAFAALISWVWLFVGSGRTDAEEQMRWALLLISVFGLAATWSGFYIAYLRRMALRWRGGQIRWHARGRETMQDMSDFDAWRRAWSGALHLRFRDGAVLKVDYYSRNIGDLLAAMNERLDTKIE